MKPEKQLYQWDTNQSLVELTPSAQFVDYPIGDEVIRIEADGTRCRIPDEVLQTYGGKTCYERYPDGTFRAYSFSVLYAPKPPDYVFTPEEHTTFEALTDRVDAAIDEIKRRADSGEFTPKKGVDYFTEEEIQQIQNEVSGGAIGDFKAVVDEETATFNTNAENTLTDYNANAQEKFDTYNTNADSKFETYNTNAETKFSEYTSNADTKLSEYNQNDSDKTALYNANAESKLGAYDSNAQAKLDLYNQNDSEKTEAYNSNAQTKLAAYNENADERISELSELNTQTEQIKNELKILATETAKSEANALNYKTDAQLSKESAATSENKAAESEANAKLYAEQAAAVFSLAGDVSFTIGADKGVTMIFTTN